MESVNEIKEALSARSRTATLDELRSEGRKRVRLVRAKHIAQMISEAVHTTIEDSGMLGQDEVDQLVDKSRKEFRSVLREREQELQKTRETGEQLEQKEHELTEIKARFSTLSKSLASTRAELEQAVNELAALRELPAPESSEPAAPAQSLVSNDMVMSLLQEFASLKATMEAQQSQQAQQVQLAQQIQQVQSTEAAAAPPADFSAALEKLTGSLNDRLETLGRKMGVSSAVEDDSPLDFGTMFDDDQQVDLEANMDNIKVKTKSAGSIADSLAKLKKLKGGG